VRAHGPPPRIKKLTQNRTSTVAPRIGTSSRRGGVVWGGGERSRSISLKGSCTLGFEWPRCGGVVCAASSLWSHAFNVDCKLLGARMYRRHGRGRNVNRRLQGGGSERGAHSQALPGHGGGVTPGWVAQGRCCAAFRFQAKPMLTDIPKFPALYILAASKSSRRTASAFFCSNLAMRTPASFKCAIASFSRLAASKSSAVSLRT
jgi:hypothetical protein